jgi:hypothetical protein
VVAEVVIPEEAEALLAEALGSTPRKPETVVVQES